MNKLRGVALRLIFLLILSCSDSKRGNNKNAGIDNTLFSAERGDIISRGEALYLKNCSSCHGVDGKRGAKDLSTTPKNKEKIAKRIRQGKRGMPSFNGILNEEEIQAIAAYVHDNIAD